MSLPPSIQRLFYRYHYHYHAERLDPERHAAIIIPTVLAEGTLEDWDWLFAAYGWDTIDAWIAEPDQRALLPPPTAHFWTLSFSAGPSLCRLGAAIAGRFPRTRCPIGFPTPCARYKRVLG